MAPVVMMLPKYDWSKAEELQRQPQRTHGRSSRAQGIRKKNPLHLKLYFNPNGEGIQRIMIAIAG